MDWKSELYFGASLGVLRERPATRSVDLTYLDQVLAGRYPRLQILTVAEVSEGKEIQFPKHRIEAFDETEIRTWHQQEEPF